jgi:lipopolysaccharide export system protein LptC
MNVVVNPRLKPRQERTESLIGRVPGRQKLSTRAFERRARAVLWLKRVLPAIALSLLSLIVLWPELRQITEAGGRAVRRLTRAATLNGALLDAHYRGVDEHGQAYTVTATSGRQMTPDLVSLNQPKADTTLSNGSWIMVTADHGVFAQHRSELDLWGHVVLYRDDGIVVRTATATIDLKTGYASGAETVSAEGPFGTLDAYGYGVGDKGEMAQFTGPARLILNAKTQ